MPPQRPPGYLDQHQRPLDVRDQTTALQPSYSPLTVGTDCGALLDSGLSPLDCYELLGTALSAGDAAVEALRFVQQVYSEQMNALEIYGIGPYYGDHSDFARHPRTRQRYVRHHLKPGVKYKSAPKTKAINCVELLFQAMTVYRDCQKKDWHGIIAKARDSRGAPGHKEKPVPSGRGTVLLEEAREQDGFVTWYYSRDTESDKYYPGVKDQLYGPPRGHVVTGADSHKKIDVGVHISSAANFLVDFAENPGALESLNKVPFGLGAADWGTHTFVFSYGDIYEDHWKQGPAEKVFQKRSFLEFSEGWPSGVIAAAPGPWS
jgi:hypothetical protein